MAIEYKGIDSVSGKGRYYDTASGDYSLGDLPEAEQQAQQQQTSEYLAKDGADDDSPYKTTPAPADAQASTSDQQQYADFGGDTAPTTTGTNPATDASLSQSPTQQQAPSVGASATAAGKAGDLTSGKKSANTPINDTKARLRNPLGDFSSYTYQLSLYMLSPEAYNQFSEKGSKTLNSVEGVYLIAQSGGINNSGPTPRAKFFDLDYYIDNLRIKTYTPAAQGTSINTLEYEFDITEPMGFTFSQRLLQQANYIRQTSALQKKQNTDPNPMNQQYVLGVRFYGYDKNGTVINGGKYAGADNVRSDESSIFERFYPIYISEMNFTFTGKPVVYHVKAYLYDTQRGCSTKTAQVKAMQTVVAGNVKEALVGGKDARGLEEILNAIQEEKVKNKSQEVANKYKIVFDKNAGDIADSLLEQQDPKNTSVGTQVTNSDQNTVGASNSNKSGAGAKKNIPISAGKNTIQVIEEIIRQSAYVKDALSQDISEDPESSEKSNPKPKQLRWFVINPVVQVGQWDTILKDWSHTITYYIKVYEVPYVKSLYAPETKKYYGPHKRYSYWFTGENSEIITYEQQFNNLYYQEAADIAQGNNVIKSGKFSNAPIATNARPAEDSTASTPNKSGAAADTVSSSLYSPADTARAKITILGDPDFIDQSCGSVGQSSPPTTTTVGRDYTWNANGGQVFIEIDFNASTDYNNQGLLSVNDQVKLWKYPPELQKVVKGVIYQVIQVDSTFNRGKFTQNLDLVICNFPGGTSSASATSDKTRVDSATKTGAEDPKSAQATDARVETTPSNQTQGSAASNSGGQYADFGADTAEPAASDSAGSQAAGTSTESTQVVSDTRATTVPTDSGKNVQDDDGNTNNSSNKAVEPSGREVVSADTQEAGFSRVRAAQNEYEAAQLYNSTQLPAGRPGSPSWNLANRNRQ